VVPGILEHVQQRGSDLARCPERPGVEAIGEHAPDPLPRSVECSSNPDEQTLHATGERSPILGFGNQVDVIRLDRELVQTESEALAPGRQRGDDQPSRVFFPQARKAFLQPDRDVDRVSRMMSRARAMRDSGARTRRLAPGTRTRATPGSERERELLVSRNTTHQVRIAPHVGLSFRRQGRDETEFFSGDERQLD